MDVEVRRGGAGDAAACAAVMASLPEHFTATAVEELRDAVAAGADSVWVAVDGDAVVAVLQLRRRYRRSAEIVVCAVARDRRGSGVGTVLLENVLDELRGDGVAVVVAKTLDGSVDYLPYVATRAFWERRGFVKVDVIDPLPGWDPGNPAAIYVRALAVTAEPRNR